MTLHPNRSTLVAAALLCSSVYTWGQTNGPISVALSPAAVSMKAGQTTSFQASVSGTLLSGVTWSLVPPVGTIENGVYTAPAVIGSPQAITVIVRSWADPSKAASATIWLVTTVGIAMTPSAASVSAGESVQFNASIAGALNTSVAWSLSPPLGTITNGLYTAPPVVDILQTVLLTVASLADPNTTAQASITLKPSLPLSISVNPAQVNLGPSQSAQFSATVMGGASAVRWSVSPNVGSMSPSGLYTAPSAISQPQTVIITAGIASDPTKSASAIVTLAAPTPPPPPPPIQLPVEVVGLDGKIVTVPFNIPSGSNVSGALTLSMRIHGLRYDTQASVQVNNSGWHPISTATVTLQGNAAGYGGIGGGFSTLQMTMPLSAGSLASGANTVSFRFNGTDGRVSGFRVLNFNLLDANNNPLLPGSAFVYEDPNTWEPPSSQASDILAGKTLYYTAPLTKPTPNGPVAIQARCTDCHAQDGRDLKYFNYSNNSIRTRSMFHGLTAEQGDQIASYIRTLNVVNPGRPWNPPYQPGPGLDSQPVINWAAGAGIDAVLDNDQEMMGQIFPNGIQSSVFSTNGNLNIREIQIPFQLPDWNQWLPGTHPKDGFGTDFTGNAFSTLYTTIRSQLNVLDAVAYTNQKTNINAWHDAYFNLISQETQAAVTNPLLWTPDMVDKSYSLPQWGMVKTWEMMNEFQLEGFAQNIFGPQADPRAWLGNQAFLTSPHMWHVPTTGAVGLRNGTSTTYYYLAYVWYHLQLILNNSNKQQQDWHPIDWGYSYGFIKDMGTLVMPVATDHVMWLIKGMQISNNGTGPQLGTSGWQPTVNDPSLLVTNEALSTEWPGISSSTQIALCEGILNAWLAQVTQFTAQQFYTGGWASASVNPVPGQPYGAFADKMWFMIPRFHYIGVNQTLVNSIADWAKTIWPNAAWDTTKTATCAPSGSGLLCTTE